MITFDHAVVNVLGEMEPAAARYSGLGFSLTPRGYHTLGSINHLAVFGDNYLELLGYAPGEREKRAELWEHPAGLTGLAFRVGDAAALHEAMANSGLPVEPWKDFSRPVMLDGKSENARFRTFQLDRSYTDNGRIFFCEHKTPELIWRPEYMRHANGVTGIAAAAIACTDPQAITAILAATPGIRRDGDEIILAGDVRLRFARIDTLADAFAGEPVPGLNGRRMRMSSLDLLCTSLDRVAALLDSQSIPHKRTEEAIQLGSNAAAGLILRFVTGRG